MRIVMLALLMLATSPAWADWVKVSESDADWNYYDPTTISKVGTDRRKVWQMHDLKVRSAEGALSRRFLGEYDCREDRWRILSFTFHSGPIARGEILFNYSAEPTRWFDIAPDTVAQQMLRLVCIR